MPPVLDTSFLSRRPGTILERLDNEMPIIIVPVPGARTATIAVGYKAGGFYETGFGAGSNDGISHFLEHMFFKGTPTMNTKEINEAFTRLGAMLNAFTSHEMTTYYAKVPVRNLEKAINLWGEMLSHVELDPTEFELERG
nr:insulinase family protein [Candidatus Sigynarchaeota archaeon]